MWRISASLVGADLDVDPRRSISASSTATVSAWKCAKSKRRRSGATSEPFWVTCVPSTPRRAACRRWVALWLSTIALRRSWSACPITRSPRFRVPAVERADVTKELAGQLLGIGHLEQHALLRQLAGIADLAAGFGVERGLDPEARWPALQPRSDRVDRLAVLEDRDDFQVTPAIEAVVTEESRWATVVRSIPPAASRRRRTCRRLRDCVRAVLPSNGRNRRSRQSGSSGKPFSRRMSSDQIRRTTVGVVQQEQLFAIDARHRPAQITFKTHHAGIERLRERGFLGLERAFDQRALSRCSSGYASPITSISGCSMRQKLPSALSAPSFHRWRMARRMIRRST